MARYSELVLDMILALGLMFLLPWLSARFSQAGPAKMLIVGVLQDTGAGLCRGFIILLLLTATGAYHQRDQDRHLEEQYDGQDSPR